MCLPFFGMPDCNFERLEIEIKTDEKFLESVTMRGNLGRRVKINE